MAQDVEIEIFGQSFRVAAGETSPEYLESLAAYVDERMRDIAQSAKSMPLTRIAVLTALNIADDLLKLQSQHDHSSETIEEKTSRLIALLQEHLPDV